ncbi:hypothetical protein SKAU_G00014980 [Synaphobranchus kaupii]|uniref:Uncharacterized protein n=1 Tax=Synaphobranchus kaupii TaxID=118154 RepID=A0A9Q1GAP3_SYNKA|nr:hypothetical protein SKAU_G00014980 [Synaphobranchus kaupii]
MRRPGLWELQTVADALATGPPWTLRSALGWCPLPDPGGSSRVEQPLDASLRSLHVFFPIWPPHPSGSLHSPEK